METYDFSLMKHFEESKTLDTVVKEGSKLILVSKMTDNGAYYDEYLPDPEFYAI